MISRKNQRPKTNEITFFYYHKRSAKVQNFIFRAGRFCYSEDVKLKICEQCKRPYLASEDFCPKCPRIEWNQESWMNFGCLIASVLPLFVIIFLWLLFFFGMFFH